MKTLPCPSRPASRLAAALIHRLAKTQRLFLLAASAALFASHARAQAVWTNADDRDYSGNPPVFAGAFWSYGYVAPGANGNTGHAGNWSGNLSPGSPGGPADAYLGAPGDTLCDVRVTLNSLTIAAGGALTMDFSSALTVANTNLATDGAMTLGGGGGSFPSYTNTGTLVKSAGAGTYAFAGDITLDSTPGSTIAVASGTLQLPGQNGLFDTVTFNPAAGTLIDLVSQGGTGTFVNLFQGTLTNGAGTGTVRLSQGTMAGTQRSGVATPLPCTLAFTGSVFQWTGGTIGSYQQGAVFNNTGVVNMVGDGSPTLFAALTNTGTMIETGAGALVLGNNNSGGSLTNATTGIVDLRSDAGIGYGGGNGNFFTNAGLFKKSAGTGTSTMAPTLTFNNQGGTVEADSGTLQLPNNGASTDGTYNAAAGAILDLGNGGFSGTYTGAGAGAVRLSQGTLTIAGQGASFSFPGALFQWTGGRIDGNNSTSPFVNTGTMTLSGSGNKLNTAAFTNQGTVVETGTGNFQTGYYNGGGNFTNAAGAIFDLQSDVGVSGDYNNPFTNAGLLKKSGGTGTSAFMGADTSGPPFVNSGTVSVHTGTLSFTNAISDISNTTLTEGTWNVYDGAALALPGNTGGITVNQGSVTLSGPNSQFPALAGLADNQGGFSLLAQRQFTTSGDLSNEGTIVLDAGSTLHVNGAFTAVGANPAQTSARPGDRRLSASAPSGSVLQVVVGGAASQGVQGVGVLQVATLAKLAGLLEVVFASQASMPAPSDTLTILSAGSISGGFDNVAMGARLPTADGKGSFMVTAGTGSAANRVTLSRFLLPGQAETVPTVTIVVIGDGQAVAGGGPAKVTVSRDGDTSMDLTVFYKVKGGATAGVDYKTLSGMVTIPAGASEARFKLKALVNPVSAGSSEVAKIKLVTPSDGSYTVGTPTMAKIRIINNG